jgi:hypothetical protein
MSVRQKLRHSAVLVFMVLLVMVMFAHCYSVFFPSSPVIVLRRKANLAIFATARDEIVAPVRPSTFSFRRPLLFSLTPAYCRR